MTFFNVYPIKLWLTAFADGVYQGKLSFTLEQYGLMFSPTECDITLVHDPERPQAWRLSVPPLHGVDVPYFSRFVEALNHYVFQVREWVPQPPATSGEAPSVSLFFDGVFFDLSGDPAKINHLMDPPQKGSDPL